MAVVPNSVRSKNSYYWKWWVSFFCKFLAIDFWANMSIELPRLAPISCVWLFFLEQGTEKSNVTSIIIITLFNEGKDIDYWSPSSFHNGPPTGRDTATACANYCGPGTRSQYQVNFCTTKYLHSWKGHCCYGYMINSPFVWVVPHKSTKMLQRNGLVFDLCLYKL